MRFVAALLLFSLAPIGSEAANKKDKKYGWYSSKAVSAGCGSSVWRSKSGKELLVTSVCEHPKNKREECRKHYAWEDAIFVEEVIEWVRKGSPSGTSWDGRKYQGYPIEFLELDGGYFVVIR